MAETVKVTEDEYAPCPDPRCNDSLGALPIPQCVTAVEWSEKALAFEETAELVLEVCNMRGWNLKWEGRSAQLHHEATELMEAVRGKRGVVLEEAGDVLFVLMSVTQNAGIPFDHVLAQTKRKAEGLMTKPRYAGEEFNPREGK